MKKIGIKLFGLWLLFLSHLTLSYGISGSWTTPGTPIPPGSSQAGEYISVSFNPTNSTYMATWTDISTFPAPPFYSIFDGTSWTPPAAIPLGASNGVSGNVFNAIDPTTGQTMAAWGDNSFTSIYYSIYNPNTVTWTTAPLSTTVGSSIDVFLSVGTTGQFLATWANAANNVPFYSFYTGSWSTPAAIDNATHTFETVFTSFNPLSGSGQFLATWSDDLAHEPVFAIYDGSWTMASFIPRGLSSGANTNVFNSANTKTGQFLATWADTGTGNPPYYSIYNSGTWSPGAAIPKDGSSGVAETITTSFDPVVNVFLATWGDSTSTSTAYYALFDGTSWTTASTVPGATSANALFSAANPAAGKFLSTWKNNTNLFPYYGIFTLTSPIPISIEPPAALTAKANISNQFGVVKEYYNLLKWTPSPTQGVVEYRIFRNSELIATVGANVFKYKDHNRKKHEFTVYGIVSVDASGNQSSPITVNVE